MSKRTAILEYLKEKKKIMLVIALVALLALTVYLFFGTGSTDVSSDSQASYSETETKLASILSVMDGVGEAYVYVTESGGSITGVIVVCEGADSILVRNNILNAVSTALNIDKNIIAIYSM